MDGSAGAETPSAEAIRAGLNRLVASPGFVASRRMRRFLAFIVDEALEGNADTLKEYRIGLEVFDRGPEFDPRTNTIVRVEARRLRRKLQEYYEHDGSNDPVLISLPPGSYAPVFSDKAPAGRSAPTRPTARWPLVVAGLVGLAILWALWWARGASPAVPPAAPSSATSIAVLPFADLTPTQDYEYLCDGFSEELINALGSVPTLKVAARTSSFQFRGKANDIRRLGAELAVEHVVEGSVRIVGQEVRVTAQLMQAHDGYQVWSRTFDGELSEILSIQERVARLVAASVGAELRSGASSSHPGSLEAYRAYLEGRHYLNQFAPTSTKQAIGHFERAIAADAAYAPAHAGLSTAYMQMNVWGMGTPLTLMTQARDAATHALRLDPDSAEAQAQLGAVSAFYDWNWQDCDRHFRRAIETQPSYVDARWLFATTCLGPQGRLDEAISEARVAVELDPLSPLVHAMAGMISLYRGELDQALAAEDEALRLAPSFQQASLFKCFVQLARGRPDLAAASQDQGPFRAYIQARLGNRAVAEQQLEAMLKADGHPIAIAAAYSGLGLPDESLDWLEKAADARMPQMIWSHYSPAFASLHALTRYRALRARMHLPG